MSHRTVCQGPIASIFWRNEEFNRGKGKDIVLDGVVCVVDAVFGKQVRLSPNAIRTLDHIVNDASKWRPITSRRVSARV